MALNWKINVASPVLTQGMSFQVRYRKLNTQSWNNLLPNPTTNEFIIYNLDNGNYEAEIRTVCANGDLSNPAYHTTQIETCPMVTDLTFTENIVDPDSYEYRSFNFMWTKVEGKTYRIEFQKNGIITGTNDNASGMNVPDITVLINGASCDKVRVVTICDNNTETPSVWYDAPTSSSQQISITSQQPYLTGGTFQIDITNGLANGQYKIRATASFSGSATIINFSSSLKTGFLDSGHYLRTGSLFNLDSTGKLSGYYIIDGDGVNCTLELLDSSGLVVSTTSFNN